MAYGINGSNLNSPKIFVKNAPTGNNIQSPVLFPVEKINDSTVVENLKNSRIITTNTTEINKFVFTKTNSGIKITTSEESKDEFEEIMIQERLADIRNMQETMKQPHAGNGNEFIIHINTHPRKNAQIENSSVQSSYMKIFAGNERVCDNSIPTDEQLNEMFSLIYTHPNATILVTSVSRSIFVFLLYLLGDISNNQLIAEINKPDSHTNPLTICKLIDYYNQAIRHPDNQLLEQLPRTPQITYSHQNVVLKQQAEQAHNQFVDNYEQMLQQYNSTKISNRHIEEQKSFIEKSRTNNIQRLERLARDSNEPPQINSSAITEIVSQPETTLSNTVQHYQYLFDTWTQNQTSVWSIKKDQFIGYLSSPNVDFSSLIVCLPTGYLIEISFYENWYFVDSSTQEYTYYTCNSENLDYYFSGNCDIYFIKINPIPQERIIINSSNSKKNENIGVTRKQFCESKLDIALQPSSSKEQNNSNLSPNNIVQEKKEDVASVITKTQERTVQNSVQNNPPKLTRISHPLPSDPYQFNGTIIQQRLAEMQIMNTSRSVVTHGVFSYTNGQLKVIFHKPKYTETQLSEDSIWNNDLDGCTKSQEIIEANNSVDKMMSSQFAKKSDTQNSDKIIQINMTSYAERIRGGNVSYVAIPVDDNGTPRAIPSNEALYNVFTLINSGAGAIIVNCNGGMSRSNAVKLALAYIRGDFILKTLIEQVQTSNIIFNPLIFNAIIHFFNNHCLPEGQTPVEYFPKVLFMQARNIGTKENNYSYDKAVLDLQDQYEVERKQIIVRNQEHNSSGSVLFPNVHSDEKIHDDYEEKQRKDNSGKETKPYTAEIKQDIAPNVNTIFPGYDWSAIPKSGFIKIEILLEMHGHHDKIVSLYIPPKAYSRGELIDGLQHWFGYLPESLLFVTSYGTAILRFDNQPISLTGLRPIKITSRFPEDRELFIKRFIEIITAKKNNRLSDIIPSAIIITNHREEECRIPIKIGWKNQGAYHETNVWITFENQNLISLTEFFQTISATLKVDGIDSCKCSVEVGEKGDIYGPVVRDAKPNGFWPKNVTRVSGTIQVVFYCLEMEKHRDKEEKIMTKSIEHYEYFQNYIKKHKVEEGKIEAEKYRKYKKTVSVNNVETKGIDVNLNQTVGELLEALKQEFGGVELVLTVGNMYIPIDTNISALSFNDKWNISIKPQENIVQITDKNDNEFKSGIKSIEHVPIPVILGINEESNNSPTNAPHVDKSEEAKSFELKPDEPHTTPIKVKIGFKGPQEITMQIPNDTHSNRSIKEYLEKVLGVELQDVIEIILKTYKTEIHNGQEQNIQNVICYIGGGLCQTSEIELIDNVSIKTGNRDLFQQKLTTEYGVVFK